LADYYFTLSVARAERPVSPEALRQVVREEDPQIAINAAHSLPEHVEERFAQAQLYLRLLAALALIAITIAAAGIYAVLAYGVAQRTPELGLRIALGARLSARRRAAAWPSRPGGSSERTSSTSLPPTRSFSAPRSVESCSWLSAPRPSRPCGRCGWIPRRRCARTDGYAMYDEGGTFIGLIAGVASAG
jgi:hypothetical protein